MNLELVAKIESAISALWREAAEKIAADEAVAAHYASGEWDKFKEAVKAAMPGAHQDVLQPAAPPPVVEPITPAAPSVVELPPV